LRVDQFVLPIMGRFLGVVRTHRMCSAYFEIVHQIAPIFHVNLDTICECAY
jgi:hypothetical protein